VSRTVSIDGSRDTTANFSLTATDDAVAEAPPHVFLSLLPDGDEKRRFVVDCLGCHSLNQRIVLDPQGSAWSQAAWKQSTDKMLAFAGPTTSFPILPPDRASEATAAFVAPHLTDEKIAQACRSAAPPAAATIRYEVTEYDLPNPDDFPHDLMRDGRGRVLVTGMFSGAMYVLDPETARFDVVEIPVPHANPRALDVDATGDWWILCGFPMKVARYSVTAQSWTSYDIGMYPHSIRVDAKRRAWFNGHFTRDPLRFGYVDEETGETRTFEAPKTPMPPEQGSPIPYGLRVAPNGVVWMTELAGNRLVSYNPETGSTMAYTLPAPHSGPRRIDVDATGLVWVPEFAAGKLARFDPTTERFEEYDFPTRDSLPYCVRVDPRRGVVWISQCGTGSIARFDPATRSFAELELPTRRAFIRHLDVDPENGDVWAAYSHSPNFEVRVVRLRVGE
jgi:streptogramin lyase